MECKISVNSKILEQVNEVRPAVREVGGDLENTVSKITQARSRKNHEDSTKGTYKEIDDSGRGGRGM